jgi:hypothetical protein
MTRLAALVLVLALAGCASPSAPIPHAVPVPTCPPSHPGCYLSFGP